MIYFRQNHFQAVQVLTLYASIYDCLATKIQQHALKISGNDKSFYVLDKIWSKKVIFANV